MTTIAIFIIAPLAGLLLGAGPPSVNDGPHNLAALGPTSTSVTEAQICVTCHTPHLSAAPKPLWDPDATAATTRPFTATSADARPSQPTGSSKLCLSCHDGTIAAGNIVSRNQPIETADALSKTKPGKPNFATDLSDDHPVSFRFDEPLARSQHWLKQPHMLPTETKVDRNGEMQCTSCHNPHDNTNDHFLVMANDQAQLCNACHQVGPTTVAHHVSCFACHQNHSSPSGDRLLRKATITATCVSCHDGGKTSPQGPDVGSDLHKFIVHDTNPPIDLKAHAPADVACTDCHDPHTMKTSPTHAPTIRANFGQVAGVSAMGTPVNPARFEYEVCFRCHGDKQDVEPLITRVIRQKNLRLLFSTSSVSFHPVEGRGVNFSVPSLRQPLTTGATIYCTDCHSSDSGKKAGGKGASGPHGSDNAGLLLLRYETRDYTPESAGNYALCYQCHDRNVILSDRSFKLHKVHVVTSSTPCSACHDSHGISSAQGTRMHNSNLINFDVRIVQKSSTGKIEFNSTGIRTGNCTLSCHGVNHVQFGY